jgi:hypothetical protein
LLYNTCALQRQTAATGVGFELAAVAGDAVPWGAWPVRLRQHDARHFFDAAAGHCDDAYASDATGSDTDNDALVANNSSTAAEATAVQTASADGTQYSSFKTVVLKEASQKPVVVKRYLPKQGGGWQQAAVYRCDEDVVNSSVRNGSSSSSSSSRKKMKAAATSAGDTVVAGNTIAASDSGSDADTAAATTAACRCKRKRSHRTEHKQQQRARTDSSDDSTAGTELSRDSRSSSSSGSESESGSNNENSSSNSSSSGEESVSPDAAATNTAATTDDTATAAAAQKSQQQLQQHVPPLPLRALLRKVWQREVSSAQAVACPAGIQLAAAPAAGSVLESALLSEIEGTIEAVLWLVMSNWQQQRAATTGTSLAFPYAAYMDVQAAALLYC